MHRIHDEQLSVQTQPAKWFVRNTPSACFHETDFWHAPGGMFWAIAERTGIPKSYLRFSLQYLGLLAAYLFLDLGLRHLANLPEHVYAEPFIAAQTILSLNIPEVVFLIIVAALVIIGCRRSMLWRPWPTEGPQSHLRYLIGMVAFLLAWQYASYGVNFYFGQLHLPDRIGLLLFAVLLCWRPGSVLPFLVMLLPIMMQFRYPMEGASLAEPLHLIRILVAFSAYGLLSGFRYKPAPAALLVLIGSIMATGYWISGTAKISMNWLTEDHIAYLLPATYANGWLSFLEVATIEKLTYMFDRINWPMKIVTLLLECGVIFMFWKRKVLLSLLFGWIFFHCAVFMVSGIAFWRWMVVEALVLWLFWKKWTPAEVTLHSPATLLLSALTIIGSMLWFNPTALAWRDAPMSYTYRLEAVGISGQHYSLPPGFFAPYDYQFTLGDFNYLSNNTLLPVVWGATNRRTAAALEAIGNESELFNLEQHLGKNRFDDHRARQFEAFIQTWMASVNAQGTAAPTWAFLQPPPLLWTFGRGRVFQSQEPIRQVQVREVTTFYHDRRYRELRKRMIREIDVPEIN